MALTLFGGSLRQVMQLPVDENELSLNLPRKPPHIKIRMAQTMLGFPIRKTENNERFKKEDKDMSNTNNSNRLVVPGAREAMDKFKMEAANDFHVPAPS